MSQHDMDLANAAGAAFRADANLALNALVSNSSGATAPATTFAYQFWADTTSGFLKQRNSANSAWITLFRLSDMAMQDSSFALVDDGDNTKKAVFQASGITTGTTRTLTLPDTDLTLAGIANAQSFSKAQRGTPVALSVSSNLVAVDLSLGNNFTLTLQATTAQTLSNPTNVVAGQKGAIYITQNGTPSTLAFASNWIQATTGTAPAVSTTASARNILTYDVFDSTHIYFTLGTAGVA